MEAIRKMLTSRNNGQNSIKTDVVILADILEKLRQLCYATYGMDPAQSFTASNLAGQAYLKVCRPDIDLLTGRDHLDLAERHIRGGVSRVFAQRLATANNPTLGIGTHPNPRHICFYLMLIICTVV